VFLGFALIVPAAAGLLSVRLGRATPPALSQVTLGWVLA
jgi:hypothetical protein